MLTGTACKTAKLTPPRKISDSQGLYLEVTPTGSKLWRVAYRFAKKQKKYSIKGAYPEVTLADARKQRDWVKTQIAAGVDPGEQKKENSRPRPTVKVAPNFGVIADEWYQKKIVDTGMGESTIESTMRRVALLKEAFGDTPVDQIESSDVLDAVARLQDEKKHSEAARTCGVASRIFRFGKPKGYCKHNPASDLNDALISESVTYKPRPGLTDPAKFGALLRDIAGYKRGWHGNIVGLALQLLPLVATRPYKEFCLMEWREVNFDKALWIIPKSRMKERDGDHYVPLSTQAIQVLRWLQRRSGNRRFVFAGDSDKPITENAINMALRAIGYDTKTQQCGHGFRRSFSTMLNREYREDGSKVWHNDIIELQLAHHERSTRAIYNESGPESLLAQRAKMMQHWGDRCEAMRDGNNVVTLKPKRQRQAA